MRVLICSGDVQGCYKYRIDMPFRALERKGVQWYPIPFLPNEINTPQLQTLINLVSKFDLVIVQRVYYKQIVDQIKQATDFVGVPIVFETDDDYLSLVPSNPCYYALAEPRLFLQYKDLREQAFVFYEQGKREECEAKEAEANELIPQLLNSRQQGIEEYKNILRSMDAVTVSTEELARTIRPYNKNVKIFENCVERVYPWQHHLDEHTRIYPIEGKDGVYGVDIPQNHGLWTIPDHCNRPTDHGKELIKVPIIGYSCTSSHFPEDWFTIVEPLNKALDVVGHKTWQFYLGDGNPGTRGCFSNTQQSNRHRQVVGEVCYNYELYLLNMANISINLAPLHSTVFNMSKSDIKAVEGGAVGAANLLPDYVTYTRHWKDGVNCLTYKNNDEFTEKLIMLAEKHSLREELGHAALEYVAKNRLMSQHIDERYEFMSELIKDTPRLKCYSLGG